MGRLALPSATLPGAPQKQGMHDCFSTFQPAAWCKGPPTQGTPAPQPQRKAAHASAHLALPWLLREAAYGTTWRGGGW